MEIPLIPSEKNFNLSKIKIDPKGGVKAEYQITASVEGEPSVIDRTESCDRDVHPDLLGLFEDLATGGYFGINIFIKMIIGFACGIFSTRVVRDRFFLPVVGSMVCTAGSFLAFEIIIFCIDYTFYPVEHVQYRLLPMLCYNVIFAWPVHTLVNMVEERFHEKKQ